MLPQQSADSVAAAALADAVALAAVGRYAAAISRVQHYESGPWAASVLALIASCYRQLGEHRLAADFDSRGLVSDCADQVGRADCATGWAADAIGTEIGVSDQLDIITHRLSRAEQLADLAAGHGQSWRLHVRLDWVRAEAELVADQPVLGQQAADRAVVSSLLHGTQRHLAKSLLIQGVCRLAAGDNDSAINSLERAAALADLAGLAPLRLPGHGLLAQLAPAGTVQRHLSSARDAADFIAANLPAECAAWRKRADVHALTGE